MRRRLILQSKPKYTITVTPTDGICGSDRCAYNITTNHPTSQIAVIPDPDLYTYDKWGNSSQGSLTIVNPRGINIYHNEERAYLVSPQVQASFPVTYFYYNQHLYLAYVSDKFKGIRFRAYLVDDPRVYTTFTLRNRDSKYGTEILGVGGGKHLITNILPQEGLSHAA